MGKRDFFKEFLDTAQWKKIEDSLRGSIGGGTCWAVDKSRKHIYNSPERRSRFCALMLNTGYAELCSEDDVRNLDDAINKQEAMHFLCHAGLVRYVIPIFHNKKFAGAVGGCGLLPRGAGSIEAILKPCAKKINKSEKIVKKLLEELHPIHFIHAEHTIHLVKILCEEILKEIYNKTEMEKVALENKRLYRETKILSLKDFLTGVYNQMYFQTRLEEEVGMAKRYAHHFSLLFMDLDDFKKVNDTFGHLAGDKVLQKFASLVSLMLRKSDVICRYGGEEFVAMLTNTDYKKALRTAERIVKKVESHEFINKHKLTVSIGVASFPVHSNDTIELLKKADMAMYEAKTTGKNKVVVFREKGNSRGVRCLV